MRWFDGKRALADLVGIADLGPRPTGSPPHEILRQRLADCFRQSGLDVTLQYFPIRPWPEAPGRTLGANVIARWNPQADRRILVGTHSDTRPIADRESALDRRRMPITGANDGASGLALLLEWSRNLSRWAGKLGIDLVAFDAEEFVYDPDDERMVLGSTYFAGQLSDSEIDSYQSAVVVDIVARDGQVFSPDAHSYLWAPEMTRDFWVPAHRQSPAMFTTRPRYEVLDDHRPLLDVGIPTVLVIDVDDPRWHTLDDRAEYCSEHALAEVGHVVGDWLTRKAAEC